MDEIILVCVVLAALLGIFGILAIFCLVFIDRRVESRGLNLRKKENPASLMVVLGSGGHTTEILTVVKHLRGHYSPRYYIMANTDKMSEEKVISLQNELSDKKEEYSVYKIPRSREVKQSWITTILSTLYAALYSFPLVFRLQPEIVLCNGPGTCIPICFAAFLLKIFSNTKVIYVESICRVETLSLSGKILYHLADEMFVQWPSLQKKFPKTKYIGRIV